MTQATKTRKSEITTGSVNRIKDKDGRTLGYLVKSDSSQDYYQVTCNRVTHCYECQCLDHIKRNHDYKHIDAVREVGECRRAAKQEAAYDVVVEANQVANDHLRDAFYASVGDPRTPSYCGDCGKLSSSPLCYRCSN